MNALSLLVSLSPPFSPSLCLSLYLSLALHSLSPGGISQHTEHGLSHEAVPVPPGLWEPRQDLYPGDFLRLSGVSHVSRGYPQRSVRQAWQGGSDSPGQV